MIWGSKDVAYDLKAMLGKKKDLDEGGLDVELITIKGGPHFCNVTHAKEYVLPPGPLAEGCIF